MRVLILRSNPISPDPRVEKIARALSDSGYSVSVLGWDRSASLPKNESGNTFNIYRLGIKAVYGNGLGNLPQLMRWQFGLLNWLVNHHGEYDVLHACDFDTILPALFIKWIWKNKVVYDIFDFYADHLRRTPLVIKNWIRKIDLWAIDRSDAVILVDDARQEQIRGSKPKFCAFIYNSPEDIQYSQTSIPDSLEMFTIAYVGLLQFERGLKEIIEIMRSHPDWKLDLAGFGGDQEEICDLAKNIPGIIFHGRVSYDVALKLSANADVLFATYDPEILNHKYSSPNKIFEGMMLGKPLIVARDTNMDRIVDNAGCGIGVPYGDVQALENAMEALQNSPELRKNLGLMGRSAYEKTYSWGQMRKRLINLYAAVLNSSL
jgi:glycosyltransferase involved in cell wall biosynthesis